MVALLARPAHVVTGLQRVHASTGVLAQGPHRDATASLR